MGFFRTWLPYLYLYGVGGLFFVVGMVLILKHHSLDLKLRKDRKWLVILLVGFVWYAFMHAAVILGALNG
ncbi:MAG: hypothetical protein ACE5HZ_05665 [Fidelibacterota bacterium]